MSEGNISEGIEDLKIMKGNNTASDDRGELDPIVGDDGINTDAIAADVSKRYKSMPRCARGIMFAEEVFVAAYCDDYHVPE
jgi:hypothetical protein